jgi:hypothetical protein
LNLICLYLYSHFFLLSNVFSLLLSLIYKQFYWWFILLLAFLITFLSFYNPWQWHLLHNNWTIHPHTRVLFTCTPHKLLPSSPSSF